MLSCKNVSSLQAQDIKAPSNRVPETPQVGISKYDTEQPSSNQQQQCSGLGGLLGGGSFVAPAGNSRSGFNRGGVGSKSSRGGSRGYD
jgi:hypothetical protein